MCILACRTTCSRPRLHRRQLRWRRWLPCHAACSLPRRKQGAGCRCGQQESNSSSHAQHHGTRCALAPLRRPGWGNCVADRCTPGSPRQISQTGCGGDDAPSPALSRALMFRRWVTYVSDARPATKHAVARRSCHPVACPSLNHIHPGHAAPRAAGEGLPCDGRCVKDARSLHCNYASVTWGGGNM